MPVIVKVTDVPAEAFANTEYPFLIVNFETQSIGIPGNRVYLKIVVASVDVPELL